MAETVSNTYVRVPYDEVFANGSTRFRPLRTFTYVPIKHWTPDAVRTETEKNFLEGEW